MRVPCQVDEVELDGDWTTVEGVCASCSRCDNTEEAYGTSDASVRRALLSLRESCPLGESNYYVEEEEPEPVLRMPWGKHKGELISDLPLSYIEIILGMEWIDRWPDVKVALQEEFDTRAAAIAERCQEIIDSFDDPILEMPMGIRVLGIYLNPVEAALFAQASLDGELVVPPDLPASSPLEAAWQAFCLHNGKPHVVRTEEVPSG